MKKFAFIIIVLFFSVNLTSCINIVRNIKVNKDGSGSENMILDFDKTFFDVMVAFATMSDSTNAGEVRDSLYNDEDFVSGIKSKLSGIPGLEVIEIYSMTNADSSKTIYANYLFDNIGLLGVSISDESGQLMGKDVEINYKDEGDQIKFSYTEIEQPRGNETDTSYTNLIEGIAELFKGKEVVYNIDFDYDIISSNATYSDGRKLTWVIPLDEKMRTGEKLHLEAVLRKN